MKKLAVLALGALFTLASVVTTDAQVSYYGAVQAAHGNTTAVISSATVVKATPGIVSKVCVVVAGSASTLQINDTTTTGAVAASNQVYSGSGTATAGTCTDIEFPMLSGIVVTPATGQTVALFYR